MDSQAIKNNLIFVGLSLGILLPIRLAFSEFVSDHWLGNLGIITATGTILIILIRKNKLGRLGHIFEKQLTSSITGKTGKFIIIASITFLVYFGTTIILIERGSTAYLADTEVFYSHITTHTSLENLSTVELQGPFATNHDSNILNMFFVLEYAFAITYAMIDQMSGGWVAHLYSVLFVEQIEILALVVFFRKKPIISRILRRHSKL